MLLRYRAAPGPDPVLSSAAVIAGCSIGLLTRLLAARADRVLAMDIAAAALQQAHAHVPDHVHLRQGAVPADWPSGRFDLVVLSELGYYLDEKDCQQLASLAATSAGDLVAVHWRHPVEDYPSPASTSITSSNRRAVTD